MDGKKKMFVYAKQKPISFLIDIVNEFIEPMHIGFGVLVGCCIAMLVMSFTEADKPPKWQWMLSIVGFFVALNWIFLLANNMVGLLKALGMIFNISDAIMGLTVFALVSYCNKRSSFYFSIH